MCTRTGTKHYTCAQIVEQIQSFVAKSGEFVWNDVFREANQTADRLAKFGRSIAGQSRIFNIVSPFFAEQIISDLNGALFYTTNQRYLLLSTTQTFMEWSLSNAFKTFLHSVL